MSNLTDDESYYCFGYANKSVKKDFKSFFRYFSTLEEAVDSLINLGDNLNNDYTFTDSDVKYKLRAKASSLDDPVKVNEVLLKWYSFVESSKYKSMGRVIEKLLMVRKQIISNNYYQACVNVENPIELAEISHVPDMLNNDDDLHTYKSMTKSFSKLDHDVNIHDEYENAPVQQKSDTISLLAPKNKISSSIDLVERSQNHKSTGLAENKLEHAVFEHFTEGGKSRELRNISKTEMVENNEDKLYDEAVLNVDKAGSADASAKNIPAVETSDGLNLAHAMSNSRQVLDFSAIEQTFQQLKNFRLDSDVPVGENDESFFESASELVPKETIVPSGKEVMTDELKLQETPKVNVDACEESDSWGSIIAISSDSESNYY